METKLARRPQLWVQENHPPDEKLSHGLSLERTADRREKSTFDHSNTEPQSYARCRQRSISLVSLGLMRVATFSVALLAASLTAGQLTDEQLRSQIVGVWYSEYLRDTLHHNAGRLQYFRDGLFIADYRLSSSGSEQYVRTRGRWSVDHGVFTETANYVAGTNESIPKFARRVATIDSQKMVLAPAAGGSARFTIWRGNTKLDRADHSMEATQKKLLSDLESMHMSGFRAVGSGPGPVSWRLDSRILEKAATKK